VAERYVLDTGALQLHKEGGDEIRPYMEAISRGAAEGLVVDLCLAELQYKLCERVGRRAAEEEGRIVRNSPIRLVRNSPYLDLAWQFKCRYRGRFGLTDCVLLAVAQVHACRILTTDGAFENLKEPRVSVKVLRFD
jgi:predicted nucleic acid-binding protein